MRRALLMANQYVLDLVLLENLVIDRQHRAARIAEHMLDPLVGQRLQDDLGARHQLTRTASHGSVPSYSATL
jgi:hypothetical protein